MKEPVKHNNVPECVAQDKHAYALTINFGGENCAVYFDIENDIDDEWIVSEGAQVFYRGTDITGVFEGCDVDEMIYMQSQKVQEQIIARTEP